MDKWETKEETFRSFDNKELFYRSWRPNVKSNKAIILLHRGHEHSGRLFDLVKELNLEDFWAFAYDARGHGNTQGKRGDAESVSSLIHDLDSFVKFVSEKYKIPVENIAVLANSIGAVVASAWVHDFAPRIRCMILAAPAFRIKLYVPFAIPLLRLLNLVHKKAFVNSYVKSTMLTHDLKQAKAYDEDTLITKSISVKILLGFHDISTRIIDDAGAINTPTQLLIPESDWVVKSEVQKYFFKSLSSKKKEIHCFPNFYHAILFEKNRSEPIAKAREFILKSFKETFSNSFLIDSDKEGFTKNEYERLKKPAGFIKNVIYSIQKISMNTVGNLSKGISLGNKTGFDSGKTLDYVYENKPQGFPVLGTAIDWFYLNSIGWKGIRKRKENLKESLKNAIASIKEDEKIKVLDIAAGCGRYTLETVNELGEQKENIYLHFRDNNLKNLEAGKLIAKKLDIKNIDFNQGDAFDKNSLVNISPNPNIVIISGLYELFSNNDIIRNSLAGLYEAMDDNGYIIYTGQPWHPQLEMIARTLMNREGKPWIMRRRTQAEIDALVENAGFQKIDMKIDSYGIFTVSTAIKRRSNEN